MSRTSLGMTGQRRLFRRSLRPLLSELFELELDELLDDPFELEFEELFELELDDPFELEFEEPFELEFDDPLELELDELLPANCCGFSAAAGWTESGTWPASRTMLRMPPVSTVPEDAWAPAVNPVSEAIAMAIDVVSLRLSVTVVSNSRRCRGARQEPDRKNATAPANA